MKIFIALPFVHWQHTVQQLTSWHQQYLISSKGRRLTLSHGPNSSSEKHGEPSIPVQSILGSRSGQRHGSERCAKLYCWSWIWSLIWLMRDWDKKIPTSCQTQQRKNEDIPMRTVIMAGITSGCLQCCCDISLSLSLIVPDDYLRDCQTQGYASQKEKVAVDPVHKLVYAATCVNEIPSLISTEPLCPIPTHGVYDCLKRKG